MIKVYVDTGYKKNDVAMKYGLGMYLSMLYEAIKFSKDIELAVNPEKADLIHLHEPNNYVIFDRYKKLNKPVIVHYHSFRYDETVVRIMKNSDLNIFVSEMLANAYTINNYKVVHNAIIPYKKFKNPMRPIDFIITTRNAYIKGLDTLTKESKGDYVKVSTGDVSIKGFKPLGYLPKKEYNFVLSLSKIHLLPSKFEPFGLATLYAMSQGCVPAITPKSGVSEIIPRDMYIPIDYENFNFDYVFDRYMFDGYNEIIDDITKLARSYDYRWYSEKIYEVYEGVIRR